MTEAWENMGLHSFCFFQVDETFAESFEPVQTGYDVQYFEEGMTLYEWAESPYNMDGWTFVDDEWGGALHSWDGEYAILTGLDINGQMYSIDDYYDSGSYEEPVMLYQNYCKQLEDYLASKASDN